MPTILLVNIAAGLQASPLFLGLGDLDGGGVSSRAIGISDNGLFVVGSSASENGTEAFRWSLSENMIGLGDIPGFRFASEAFAVSSDGAVVVGRGSSSVSNFEAFRWTSVNGAVGLGFLDQGFEVSRAFGVSSDGSVIVGQSGVFPNPVNGFVWTENDGMVRLPSVFRGGAAAISNDGTTVVGWTDLMPHLGGSSEAAIWRDLESGGTLLELGTLPQGNFSSANAISADGSVVVGQATNPGISQPDQAFRWTAGTGIVSLGDLPNIDSNSIAFDVSGDGSIIVGSANNVAFIWDAVNGMRELQEVLELEIGLDLTGWNLTEATGISDNGLLITGTGINPLGQTEAWIVTLPEPASILVIGTGFLLLLRPASRNWRKRNRVEA